MKTSQKCIWEYAEKLKDYNKHPYLLYFYVLNFLKCLFYQSIIYLPTDLTTPYRLYHIKVIEKHHNT